MKMNRKELFALMGKLDDRYIAASAYIAEGGEDVIYERPARRRAAAFFQSGWFVAVLCAVVSLSVVGAMVWAGRHDPTVPPEGTTAEESEVSSEQIRVEDETEVTVKTRKKVTVTVKDCLGRPYEIVYYLTYVPTYGLCISPVVPMVPAPTFSITLQTQAEGHLICNPEVMMGVDLTHTFTSEEEAIAYADQLVGAIVHVGYDNEHLFCTACNTDVGERTYVNGNKVTFITRNCVGKICSITYSVKEDPVSSAPRWIVQNISAEGYIEWKDENIEHIYSDFATREDAINFGSQLKNELVVHTEYRYTQRIAPTCTEAGVAQGTECAACGKIFVAPSPIPATGDHRITWSKCETCDLTASEGLIYIPYGQNSCYVAGFADAAPDKTKAVIPTYAPDGRPVIGVADGAFEGCDTLTYVLLPKIVSYIGVRSFADCPALEEVYFSGQEGQWRVNVNKATDWCDENVTVSFYGDRITS